MEPGMVEHLLTKLQEDVRALQQQYHDLSREVQPMATAQATIKELIDQIKTLNSKVETMTIDLAVSKGKMAGALALAMFVIPVLTGVVLHFVGGK